MEAVTTQSVEDMMLNASQLLTDAAYERLTQGDISPDQLQQFYAVLRNWSRAGELVLDLMNQISLTQRQNVRM